jgi:hypothetical protein
MSEFKASFDENGKVVLKKKSNISRGKKSRASGARFELKVRKELEELGWVVDKWTNNVDLENKHVIPARRKFNPFSKVMSIGTGFPDFFASKHLGNGKYELIGIEVKSKGFLDKEEKEKCKILLDKNIFSKILIARKSNVRGKVDYVDFSEKWKK